MSLPAGTLEPEIFVAMKIDSHHHFWNFNSNEYGWIDAEKAALRRDFLPPDLKLELDAAGIDGVVSVQARETVEETEVLLAYAAEHSFIRGVVGWIPIADPDRDDLIRLAANPTLKAVRHVVQDELDDDFILGTEFNRGVGLLHKLDLAYDVLIYERHLPQTIQFVDRHPKQVFVLDHIGKPRIRDGSFVAWREAVARIAERPNVSCKISGMVTEADLFHWTERQLQPYLETVLESFGPKRLMFGSDWPVCLLACSYQRWVGIVSDFLSRLSDAEQAQIFGQTATNIYKL